MHAILWTLLPQLRPGRNVCRCHSSGRECFLYDRFSGGGHIHVIVKQWKLSGQGSDLIRKGKSLEPSGWYQLIFCWAEPAFCAAGQRGKEMSLWSHPYLSLAKVYCSLCLILSSLRQKTESYRSLQLPRCPACSWVLNIYLSMEWMK